MSLHICISCFKEISSDCDECPNCKIKYPFERGKYKCLECKEHFIHPLDKEACSECGSKSYSFVSLIDSKRWNQYITKKDINEAVYDDDIYNDVKLAIQHKFKKINKILNPIVFIFIFIFLWITKKEPTSIFIELFSIVLLVIVSGGIMLLIEVFINFLMKKSVTKDVLYEESSRSRRRSLEMLTENVDEYNMLLILFTLFILLQKHLFLLS